MGRPKNDWYRYIQRTLKMYPNKLHRKDTIQSVIAEVGIRRALEETSKLPDGKDRVLFIKLYYIMGTHTLEGAAYAVHISERTAVRWSKAFIMCCAKHMGFLPTE